MTREKAPKKEKIDRKAVALLVVAIFSPSASAH
jgi:hypothetical protein